VSRGTRESPGTGKEKSEKWCKRAIWQNTLPTIKQILKSVDKLTSTAFVDMWQDRVDHLYARWSEAIPKRHWPLTAAGTRSRR
jgi:hypothetical protein